MQTGLKYLHQLIQENKGPGVHTTHTAPVGACVPKEVPLDVNAEYLVPNCQC